VSKSFSQPINSYQTPNLPLNAKSKSKALHYSGVIQYNNPSLFNAQASIQMLLALQQRFLHSHVRFVKGENGFIKIIVDNSLARCELYLHGAHITSFTPKGGGDQLWMSQSAIFEEDKAIRGGIPICWPWFGRHPTDQSKPAHGFARTSLWQLSDVRSDGDGATQLLLTLIPSQKTLALWPYKFELQYTITVTKSLKLTLMTINHDVTDIQISEALHSYLRVSDIEQATIGHLDGIKYFDKLTNVDNKTQKGDVAINQPCDRVYKTHQACCMLVDKVTNTKVRVTKSGSGSTVVWNPLTEMTDIHINGYKTMLCIEAANVMESIVNIGSGQRHQIGQSIELVSSQ
jgi:glucose-6-phosphate 1-epimerase